MVSNITDVVTDEIEIWRNRPVDEGRFLLIVANDH
jgi:transposase-like protein